VPRLRGLIACRAESGRRPPVIAESFKAPKGYSYEPERPLDPAFTARTGVVAAADKATITIFDYIGDGGFTDTAMAAILRNIGETKPVVLEMNSPGGDYFQGVAIYNMLARRPGPVAVQVLGLAASVASLIAMAADKIEIAANAEIMIHNAWAVAIGNRLELGLVAERLARLDASMANTYAARTGRSVEELAQMLDAETFLNGQEAVDKGFADSILAQDHIPLAYAGAPDTEREWERRLKQGRALSRSEIRDLFSELKGKRDAAPEPKKPAKQDAGLDDLAHGLRALRRSMSQPFQPGVTP
jgi:ATP-dependent Clp endopeptidase proteolytic subunit ClpP